MFASDFRRTARECLKGRWITAVIVGLVASLLGGISSTGAFSIDYDFSASSLSLDLAGKTIFSTSGLSPELQALLVGGVIHMAVMIILISLVLFLLGSVIEIGYSRFNLELVDGAGAGIEDLFAYFRDWKNAAATRILKTLYIALWTFVFVIPGIVASYSYAMTGYILAENPELTAGEAIRLSKEMMRGNRWRLFCLQFSFIGWDILASFTLGVGNLFLRAYKSAAEAAFYREISGAPKFEGAEEYNY